MRTMAFAVLASLFVLQPLRSAKPVLHPKGQVHHNADIKNSTGKVQR